MVGSGEVGCPGGAGEPEASFVEEGVVAAAHHDQVVEVGGASVGPMDDVMDVTPVGRTVTAGEPAMPVTNEDGPALGGGDGP